MKKIILLLVTVLLSSFIAATAQNKIDKQGRRQGHWMRVDKDGSKIFEGDFVDGKETGVFTYYYHDGSIRMRNTYTVAGKVCRHEAYDEKGHKLADGWYNQHNRDSVWHFYNEDGRLVKEASYRMGVRHGLHVVFNQDGDTAEVATWSDNHRHGRWWKRIGKKGYITGTYVRGGMEGRVVEFDDNGKMVRDGNYHAGLKHGSYKYFEDGVLNIDEEWTNGQLNDRKIRIVTNTTEYVSIFDITCLARQGARKVVIVMNDGSKKIARESAEEVFARLGNEVHMYANKDKQILVARRAVQGIGKDKEAREIILLDPQPDFDIFPDEDGKAMARSRKYDDESPLDKIIK